MGGQAREKEASSEMTKGNIIRGIGLHISRLRCWSRLAILLGITVLLLGSACILFPQPPPEPPPPEPENQPPAINGMTAEKEVVPLSESLVSCQATDADGDDLVYWWSSDDGVITGEGHSVAWMAPELDGDYVVRVIVTDGKGGEANESVTIAVIAKPNQPPVIVSLLRDGSPPDELNRIRNWRTTTIECIVEDPDGDELSFIWSATGGKVQGEGAAVGWTAPGVAGNYTVTAIVSDGRGGQAEASVEFEVLCCGQ